MRYLSKDNLDILYGNCTHFLFYTWSLHAFISRLYRPQQVDVSKGTMIYLPSPAVSVHPWVHAEYICCVRRQATLFSAILSAPRAVFRKTRERGRGRTRRYPAYERCCRIPGLFRLYSFALFFSVFRSNIPREILYVIAIQSCVSEFRLTIASNHSRICDRIKKIQMVSRITWMRIKNIHR